MLVQLFEYTNLYKITLNDTPGVYIGNRTTNSYTSYFLYKLTWHNIIWLTENIN